MAKKRFVCFVGNLLLGLILSSIIVYGIQHSDQAFKDDFLKLAFVMANSWEFLITVTLTGLSLWLGKDMYQQI